MRDEGEIVGCPWGVVEECYLADDLARPQCGEHNLPVGPLLRHPQLSFDDHVHVLGEGVLFDDGRLGLDIDALRLPAHLIE
jgi:hypothetical protein